MPPNDDYEPGYPDTWSDTQSDMVAHVLEHADHSFMGDEHALELIDAAFYNMDISSSEREIARTEAAFYFYDNYDLDIFDDWDWDDYRDWYDAA